VSGRPERTFSVAEPKHAMHRVEEWARLWQVSRLGIIAGSARQYTLIVKQSAAASANQHIAEKRG